MGVDFNPQSRDEPFPFTNREMSLPHLVSGIIRILNQVYFALIWLCPEADLELWIQIQVVYLGCEGRVGKGERRRQ